MTFQHRAGVSPYTSHCWFAWTCVFGKQSLGPFLCSSISGAILLPRLRMHFAEFLNANSSVRLRILSSPTCVGLWYGPSWTGLRKCFSARRLDALRLPVGRLPPGSPQDARLTAPLVGSPLRPGLPSPGCASPYASFHRIHERHGNLDPFPIGYDLRPRLRGRLTPGQIAFTLETLGFRRTGIPPVFSLLMPAFSLPSPPAGLPPNLHRYMECSPTPRIKVLSRSFGGVLSPVELSAHDYSTSELLRTL